LALNPAQQRYSDRFWPGVIERISSLGAGEFEPQSPRTQGPGLDAINFVSIQLKYALEDKMVVDMRSRWRLRDGRPPYVPKPGGPPPNLSDWERVGYSFHYGVSFTEVKFRIDLDDANSYHVHIPPNTDRHTPAELVEPDTKDIDPIAFLEMVAAFRGRGIYPLQRKTKR
jgi:hypothetical protein